MANVTIPNLPSASNIVPSTDLLILEQTNGTRKATIDQVFVNANLPTITYSTWQGYTDEQKEDFVGYISGVPDETLNASSIVYDGTTSGSSNTNVQDELDTINSNLTTDTPDYELPPSGRTWGQTMYALDNAVDKSKITRHSCIEWGGIYAHIEYKAPNYVGYAWNIVNVSAQKARTIYCKMGSGQNEVVEVEGTTFSDLSSVIATDTVKFYY